MDVECKNVQKIVGSEGVVKQVSCSLFQVVASQAVLDDEVV